MVTGEVEATQKLVVDGMVFTLGVPDCRCGHCPAEETLSKCCKEYERVASYSKGFHFFNKNYQTLECILAGVWGNV